ncbi:Gfo/Idh/MocA family protein [Chromatium okenii]|uniref:Gfo/Idh/MocA family protein n=1 Tax=Chromatium okenii TaxID=61644 RepID=UPI0026EB3F9C|nr:Gfo/Idh/MocA family oxidoreductase [Chromatium okenii]MBV5309735.1 Gfo/Idh/MocA family oxidoreductase [Chromatium okenii]
MTNDVLKLGFIGGGINSAVGMTHFIAAQMDGRFRVEAGCFSRNAETNTQTAQQWGIPLNRVYNNGTELLAHEQNHLDAIVVLTPTPDHVDPVLSALRSGFPVICEKALTASSAEARTIQHAVIEQQGFLAVTYNYTGYPMLRELKNMIAQGYLGRIEQIHIEMPQEGFARLNRNGEPMVPQQWRLRDAEVPTISLDLGVHIHHLVDFLTGEKPYELVAVQNSLGTFRQVVDNTMAIVRYTHDLDCSIWFSKAALGYRNGLRIRVFGDRASTEWYQMDPEFLIHHDNKGHKTVIDRASADVELAQLQRYNRFKSGHPAGFLEAFANLYWDIAESLQQYRMTRQQSNCQYVFNTQHALEGLIMLEAIAQSSNQQCWKTVDIRSQL